MIYEVSKNLITVADTDTFNIADTLSCGQVFRYVPLEDGGFQVIAGDKCAVVKTENSKICIYQNDSDFFVNYFDLDRNYDIILNKLSDTGMIGDAKRFGRGIRILNQDPVEMIFSFIISANNHIPRIKGIIERLCQALGEDCGGYFAFPTVEKLASKGEDFYLKLGAGYRASYLSSTARAIADGFDVDAIRNMNSTLAAKKLCTLLGVGPKVADCILLFGYHKTDVFPVDTWIKKVFQVNYGPEASASYIRNALTAEYGELSGYAQQYLFYFKRELDKNLT